MLQSNGSMIGVLLGNLRNKTAWFVDPNITTNMLHLHLSSKFNSLQWFSINFIREMTSGMRQSSSLTCTIRMWWPSMVLCLMVLVVQWQQ